MTSSLTFAQAIAQLNSVRKAHKTDLISHAADKNKSLDKEKDSNCPLLEVFCNDGASAAVKSMCNFTVPRFDEIWLMVAGPVSST